MPKHVLGIALDTDSITLVRLTGSIKSYEVTLATQYRLPAVYPFRLFTVAGGLMSYGVDLEDLIRRAAAYVDRVMITEIASPRSTPRSPPLHASRTLASIAESVGLWAPATGHRVMAVDWNCVTAL